MTPLNHVNRHREHSRDLFEAGPSASSSNPSYPRSATTNVFRETPLTPGEIANNLRDELKRLRRRRQLATPYDTASAAAAQPAGGHGNNSPPGSPSSAPSSPEPMMDDATAMRTATSLLRSVSLAPGTDFIPGGARAAAAAAEGKPIFTLRQMTLICERMCKERTDQVRDEYDKILHQKLSEQYDAFVKFIDHQIQQRFNEAQLPSYLS
jgi:hypothetical protein